MFQEERDPIWGDDWSHSPFIRWSPSWGFLGFSSAVRQMPGDVHDPWDHFTITLIINNWCDTQDKWPLARNPDRSWWHCHTSLKVFWPQSMAPWTAGKGLVTRDYGVHEVRVTVYGVQHVLGAWVWLGNQIIPSFSLQWKSDKSTKHYLTQMLLAINWHYWQVRKSSCLHMKVQGCLMQMCFIEIHQDFANKEGQILF